MIFLPPIIVLLFCWFGIFLFDRRDKQKKLTGDVFGIISLVCLLIMAILIAIPIIYFSYLLWLIMLGHSFA
jgi:hypothetical protein